MRCGSVKKGREMYAFERLQFEDRVTGREEERPSALDRITYLCPSRYFHQYLYYDKASRRSCWLPEGHNT